MSKNNLGLLYLSVVILGLIILNEFSYTSKTSLAWVVIWLSFAVGLQGIYLIKRDKDK